MRDWTPADAASLREYLSTPSGVNLMETLESEEEIKETTTDFAAEALKGREEKGRRSRRKRILELAAVDENPENKSEFLDVSS